MFSIRLMGERRGMKALELWCKKVTDGYPNVKIENMTTSWRDGLAFCALIHHFRPDLIDFPSLEKGDVYRNNELAFRTAERHLGIPALLDAEDMALYEVPDRLSILTYLSQFYQVFASQGNSPVKRSPEPAERALVLGSTVQAPSTKETSCGLRRKEPCRKCGLPVFLAQRLIIDGHLYHRTCFRCARCSSQLTLANYYETMDGVHCCETCPDEEEKTVTKSNTDKTDASDDMAVNKDNNLFIPLDNNNQLTTAIEKTERLVSNRKESLVGIRKMMFENLDYSSKPKIEDSELTDDDKVVIKAKKGSLVTGKFNKISEDTVNLDKIESESPLNNSDKILINSSDIDNKTVDVIVDKLSDINIGIVKSSDICVNNDDVASKHKDISDHNDKDLPYIDSDCDDINDGSIVSENNSDSNCLFKDNDVVNEEDPVKEKLLSEYDNSVNVRKAQCKNVNSLVEDVHCDESVDKVVESSVIKSTSEDVSKKEEIENIDDNAYVEMKSFPEEPIYEEIPVFDNSRLVTDVKDCTIDNLETSENVVLGDSVNPITCDSNKVELEKEETEVVDEKLSNKEAELVNNTAELEENNVSAENQTEEIHIEKDILNSEEVEIQNACEEPNKTEKDEKLSDEDKEDVNYPSELNPFGDEDEEGQDEKNQTASTNPFESDMDDDEEEENKSISNVPKPAARIKCATMRVEGSKSSNSYDTSLNPFGSDSEDLDDDEQSSLLSPPVPLPRKLRTPQMSPTPVPRSSRHKHTPSVSSAISSIYSEGSPSPRKKKLAAPAPPSNNSTLRSRKARPPPPPPPPSSSVASDNVSAPVTPIMREKLNIVEATAQQISSDTFNRNKSTFGQWKRRKGQAPAPPIAQRRSVKPMPMNEVRQELLDIEVKQQELERQGVALEQTIRDRFDQETSVTPYVEELVLQLFELVNEKNELFRRQAELMYLRRQHNLEEEHAELEYQIRCLMLCPEHNKTDSDKEREEELIKRLVDVVERRNAIIQGLEMDRVRETEEDRSVSTQLGNFSAAIGSEIDLTQTGKKEKKLKKDKKKHTDAAATLDRSMDKEAEKVLKYKKLKKKWFTLQHPKKH